MLKLINTVIDNVNIPIMLLNYNKKKFNLLEKFVYDIALYHFSRLNLEWDNDNYYIEFWVKNNKYSKKHNIIHSFHYDKDETYYHTNNIFKYPLFSTVTYLNDSIHPTIITDILNNDMNNIEQLKKRDKEIYISFPKKLKHIYFNGSCLHGVCDIFDDNNDFHNIDDRLTIMFKVWEKDKPLNKEDYSDEINNTIHKNNLLFEIHEQKLDNIYKIKPNLIEINHFVKNIIGDKLQLSFIKQYINKDIFNKYDIIKISNI